MAIAPAYGVVAQDGAGTLAVSVVGLPSSQGVVRFAVFEGQQTFDARTPRSEFEGDCLIVENRCEFSLPNLPYGEYAVMVYHDVNMDKEYNWGLFDRELVGVSNYTSRLWSSPDYDQAKFPHRAVRTAIEIRVY